MTANTRSWKDAEAAAMKERLRLDPAETEKRRLAGLNTARNLHGGPVTVKDALEQWVRGLEAQTYSTSRSYKAFVGKVTRWAQRNSIAALQDVTPDHLDLWRSEWGLAAHPDGRIGPITQQQMQMRLKAFFKWATGLRKIAWNPTLSMGRIQSNPKRTIPLTEAQFELLIPETERYDSYCRRECDKLGTELKAIFLVQRWTGLRIVDVLLLPAKRSRAMSSA
jgi:site-specific recombinase XerD